MGGKRRDWVKEEQDEIFGNEDEFERAVLLSNQYIKQELTRFIEGELFQGIKQRLPRSNFAGIRNVPGSRYRVRSTNNLRNSLLLEKKFQQRKTVLTLSIPAAQVPYAAKLDQKMRYITRGYWSERMYQWIYDELESKSEQLENEMRR